MKNRRTDSCLSYVVSRSLLLLPQELHQRFDDNPSEVRARRSSAGFGPSFSNETEIYAKKDMTEAILVVKEMG